MVNYWHLLLGATILVAVGGCGEGLAGPRIHPGTVQLIASGIKPSVSGNLVLWLAETNGPIVGQNVSDGESLLIESGDSSRIIDFDVHDDRVVWSAAILADSGGESEIVGTRIVIEELATKERTIISQGGEYIRRNPDVGNAGVVWRQSQSDGSNIVFYSLKDREVWEVGENSRVNIQPRIDGKQIVWARITEFTGGGGVKESEILLHDLTTGTTSVIEERPGRQGNPDISNNVVVWIDVHNGVGDVVYRNLTTGELVNVTNGEGIPSFPRVNNGVIVWEDSRFGSKDVFMHRVVSGETIRLTDGGRAATRPVVSGRIVVWQELREEGFVIVALRM